MRCVLSLVSTLTVCVPLVGCSGIENTGGSGGAAAGGGSAGAGGHGGSGAVGGAGGEGGRGGDTAECELAADCPYGGACATARCIDRICDFAPIREGEGCGTDECTVDGVCSNGECVGTPLEDGTACTRDLNQCTADVCMSGACEHPVFDDGTACDEDNECTVMGACTAAECFATPAEDGTGCGDGAGTCEAGRCSGEFACTEEGIREAIALGGGPHTFACDGPTTVMVAQGFTIERDVELDGGGLLTLEGVDLPTVFSVGRAAVTLGGFRVLRGGDTGGKSGGGAIENRGKLTLADSTVSESCCWFAIYNEGDLLVLRTSIVDNPHATGVFGQARIMDSTITGNLSSDVLGIGSVSNSTIGVLRSYGPIEIAHSTIGTLEGRSSDVVVRGSVVRRCPPVTGDRPPRFVTSEGYNIQVSWDSCGFDQPTDQVSVAVEALKLGWLQDNGGPTMTHALGAGSVAIDVIPGAECVDADGEPLTADQRGAPRDSMCDVGAFEVQEGEE